MSDVAGPLLTVEPPAGGVQLLAHLDPRLDDRAISDRLAQAGVTARPLSPHFTGTPAGQGLFLGFAAWNEQEIDTAAAIIGQVLRDVAGPGKRAAAARKRPAKA